MKAIKVYTLVILLSTLCISCADLMSSADVNSGLRSELNDRGKTKLDPSNPYVAPNAFLAEEAKRSDTLKGFLSIKGNPNALSYHETFFGDPELSLYYEDKGELFFTAKPSGQPETTFKLISNADGKAVFENPQHDFPTRVIYGKQPDGSLLARIEGTMNGQKRGIDFPFKRAKCE